MMQNEENSEKLQMMEILPVGRLVLRLGVPAMFAQLFNILYSIVDRIFVGRIPGTGSISLASIGVCAPALTAVTAFAFMVGVGGASCMSISLGKKDRERAKEIISNALNMLLLISAVVTVLLWIFHKKLLYLLGCSEAMYPYASVYFLIYVSGTVMSLCGTGLNQFVLAQGMARQGMISVIIGAVSNLAFDVLFIYGLQMGVAGAACGTVLAQTCMTVYVMSVLRRPDTPIRLTVSGRLNRAIVCRILSIGLMPFLITILDNFIVIFLNATLRKYGGEVQGDALIVCATVVQSFMTITFCPAQGITTGCGTIFGYHYGARNYNKLKKAFGYVFLLCIAYIGLMEIAVQMFPAVFVGLFLEDGALTEMASRCIRMYTLGLWGVAVQYALVDSLTAMGRIRFALPMSLFRKMIYLVALAVIPMLMDVKNVFWVGTISDCIGATFSIVVFFLFVSPKLRRELSA